MSGSKGEREFAGSRLFCCLFPRGTGQFLVLSLQEGHVRAGVAVDWLPEQLGCVITGSQQLLGAFLGARETGSQGQHGNMGSSEGRPGEQAQSNDNTALGVKIITSGPARLNLDSSIWTSQVWCLDVPGSSINQLGSCRQLRLKRQGMG